MGVFLSKPSVEKVGDRKNGIRAFQNWACVQQTGREVRDGRQCAVDLLSSGFRCSPFALTSCCYYYYCIMLYHVSLFRGWLARRTWLISSRERCELVRVYYCTSLQTELWYYHTAVCCTRYYLYYYYCRYYHMIRELLYSVVCTSVCTSVLLSNLYIIGFSTIVQHTFAFFFSSRFLLCVVFYFLDLIHPPPLSRVPTPAAAMPIRFSSQRTARMTLLALACLRCRYDVDCF